MGWVGAGDNVATSDDVDGDCGIVGVGLSMYWVVMV